MLHREQAALIVIDIQDIIMPKTSSVADNYLNEVGRIIQVAHTLELPILATEQYPEKFGSTNTQIIEHLGENIHPIPKLSFSCFGSPEFRTALEATGRKQLLVVGMETHICVMQTVLDAMNEGYEAFAVRDAIVSRKKREYATGLKRMARNGAQVVTTQMAIFELLREAGTPEFKQLLPLLKG